MKVALFEKFETVSRRGHEDVKNQGSSGAAETIMSHRLQVRLIIEVDEVAANSLVFCSVSWCK